MAATPAKEDEGQRLATADGSTVSIADFSSIDTNGDGVVDRAEWDQYFAKVKVQRCTEEGGETIRDNPMMDTPVGIEVQVLGGGSSAQNASEVEDVVQRNINTRAAQNELRRETRLAAAENSCCWVCRRIHADISYCFEESHEMLVAWLCPKDFQARLVQASDTRLTPR